MQDTAKRMRTLIQDLLTFSRLNTSERILDINDLNKIVDDVKNDYKDTIAEKQATIEEKKLCEVKIIPFQFYQLRQTLISNALKFSKPNTPPYIIIKSEIISVANSPFEGKEACHISVSDNSIGFEKQVSEKIFQACIAHEIQNPFNFVNNFSEVNTELIDELEHEVEKGNLDEIKAIAKDIKDNEQKINHHGKRADAIVKGMLQHSRISNGLKEATDISKLADEYLRLPTRVSGQKTKLSTQQSKLILMKVLVK